MVNYYSSHQNVWVNNNLKVFLGSIYIGLGATKHNKKIIDVEIAT